MKYISILLVSIFILSSCNTSEKAINTDDVKINLGDVSVSTEKEEMKKPLIEKYNIVDVTDGKEVRWVTTSDTKWYGKAAFSGETYSLAVLFENLPEPQNGDFYEWWLVQKEPFKFISTGEIENKDGMDVNIFTSKTDYSSYDFYVLTLEPDDWNPAPADHIIEWTLEF